MTGWARRMPPRPRDAERRGDEPRRIPPPGVRAGTVSRHDRRQGPANPPRGGPVRLADRQQADSRFPRSTARRRRALEAAEKGCAPEADGGRPAVDRTRLRRRGHGPASHPGSGRRRERRAPPVPNGEPARGIAAALGATFRSLHHRGLPTYAELANRTNFTTERGGRSARGRARGVRHLTLESSMPRGAISRRQFKGLRRRPCASVRLREPNGAAAGPSSASSAVHAAPARVKRPPRRVRALRRLEHRAQEIDLKNWPRTRRTRFLRRTRLARRTVRDVRYVDGFREVNAEPRVHLVVEPRQAWAKNVVGASTKKC